MDPTKALLWQRVESGGIAVSDNYLPENAQKIREGNVPFQQIPRTATGVALSTSDAHPQSKKLVLKIDKRKLAKTKPRPISAKTLT